MSIEVIDDGAATILYNDNDENCCAWLRSLIATNEIPYGDVWCRSITDIQPNELKQYVQCHFFAGIGGWARALALAGVSTSTPVWTGSCPCQPISGSGAMAGSEDARHLWPQFYRLIAKRNPAIVFGENVAGGTGVQWLDAVALDLEEIGYAVGSADLPAAGVGADHVRQRLWWFAHASGQRQSQPGVSRENSGNNQTLEFREADRFVDAVRRGDLPFLCRSHDGVSITLARCAGKGFGNAIVPQVAARFIQAAMGSGGGLT